MSWRLPVLSISHPLSPDANQLVVVFAVGLSIVSLFFDHYDRESQLLGVLAIIGQTLPASLPWLWAMMQRRRPTRCST